jgi:hypothetical protein
MSPRIPSRFTAYCAVAGTGETVAGVVLFPCPKEREKWPPASGEVGEGSFLSLSVFPEISSLVLSLFQFDERSNSNFPKGKVPTSPKVKLEFTGNKIIFILARKGIT